MMNNPRHDRASRLTPTHPTTRRARLAATPVTDEADFLATLPVIDDITNQVCRRHHLRAEEAEEFRSDVRMHFIERNYEVLRRFEGRASLRTYINIVVQRLFLDHRNQRWGRWRPSVEAQRLGPTAILLERMVTRDGWSGEQAVEMLRVNDGVTIDAALLAFCDTLAGRSPVRRFVPEEDAREVAANGPLPDSSVVRAEREFLAKRVMASLARAQQSLAPMDRLILKMRFEQRMAVADIARALSLEQRPLYRTVDRIMAAIRERMTQDGIDKADVDAVFEDQDVMWMTEEEHRTAAAAPLTPAAEGERSSWQRD
jgi:RNA polymerase sigma factor for flagellar operon FliA